MGQQGIRRLPELDRESAWTWWWSLFSGFDFDVSGYKAQPLTVFYLFLFTTFLYIALGL